MTENPGRKPYPGWVDAIAGQTMAVEIKAGEVILEEGKAGR